jgi:hypothetical protein
MPIFQIADYGIIGDVFEVLPALTAEFNKFFENRPTDASRDHRPACIPLHGVPGRNLRSAGVR